MTRQYVNIITVIALIVFASSTGLLADSPTDSLVILDFEDLTASTVYVSGNEFNTSVANVTIGSADDEPNDTNVSISNTNLAGGSGIELGEIKNATLDFDFQGTIDFLEFSLYQANCGFSICINGQKINADSFRHLDSISIGGADLSVISNDPNQGQISIVGTIYSFKVGGTSLWIDNMKINISGSTTFFVDVNGKDDNTGLDQQNAFATIQKGINTARPFDTVAVYPGTYNQTITFLGKPLTLKAVNDPPVIQAPGAIAVSFTAGDDKDTIMENFIIENCGTAIFSVAGAPTIRNLTVVGNEFGITAYDGSAPEIYNCIFWDNSKGDVSGCQVSYSSSSQLLPGIGNISADPMFVRPAGTDDNGTPEDPNDDFYISGDYHLKSGGWRWSDTPVHNSNWYYDLDGTSRCIDAGMPSYELNNELGFVPDDPDNIWGVNIRVNMGAYGTTAKASLPPHEHAFLADINNDGIVNANDLWLLAGQWLESDIYIPSDLTRDGIVNLSDFACLSLDWGKMNEWAKNISLTEYWPFELFAKWESEIVDEIGFSYEITDMFAVNGIQVWQFTNEYFTDEGSETIVENRFYLDGVLYSVKDPNHLQTLPGTSENYKPLFLKQMVHKTPFQFETGPELTPVRGSWGSIREKYNITEIGFIRGIHDVCALFENFQQPGQKLIAVFARGLGPLYIDSEYTESMIISDYFLPSKIE